MPSGMPRTLPWRALIHFAIAAAATVLFAVLAEAVIEGEYDAPDRAMALAVHHLSNPVLDYVMIVVTYLGSGPVLAVAVAATSVWLWRGGHRRTTLVLVSNAIAAQLVTFLLKLFVQRPRPTLFEVIARPESWSFPSGHSLSAMAIYGSIAAVIVTFRRRDRVWVLMAAGLLIAAIGFSRVYLGVHWPFDVVAGFVAGVPLLVATVHLLHTRAGPKSGRQPDSVNVYSRA
jgi:undecaprenyl-diphosphatase